MVSSTAFSTSAQAWHQLAPDAALAALNASREGLDPADAAARLAAHGPNALPAAPPVHPLRRLLAQFNNALILFVRTD